MTNSSSSENGLFSWLAKSTSEFSFRVGKQGFFFFSPKQRRILSELFCTSQSICTIVKQLVSNMDKSCCSYLLVGQKIQFCGTGKMLEWKLVFLQSICRQAGLTAAVLSSLSKQYCIAGPSCSLKTKSSYWSVQNFFRCCGNALPVWKQPLIITAEQKLKYPKGAKTSFS